MISKEDNYLLRRVEVSPQIGSVAVEVLAPPSAHALWVLAHGAGADMHHAAMIQLSEAMGQEGIATWRYQFPYTERGGKRPDHARILHATVRANVTAAREAYPNLPLFAGGRSMGGRMSVQAQVEVPLPDVCGLIFVGYPLVPAQGGPLRDAPIRAAELPMLFLQGTRDKLAPLSLLEPICREIGVRATLHIVEGGDHSLAVPKRGGLSYAMVLASLAQMTSQWMATCSAKPP